MKKLIAMLLVVLLLVSCAPKENPESSSVSESAEDLSKDSSETEESKPEEAAPVEESEEAAEPVLKEVDEDVFYYANALEFNRLYSQRIDGSDLTLVLDAYCYDVKQQGDTVYYSDGRNLCTYYIPTGEQQIFIEDVIAYDVDDHYLAYTQDGPEEFQVDLRCRNLETGEDISIETVVINDFTLGYGQLYYTWYDVENGTVTLSAYDTTTRLITTIADQYASIYTILSAKDGVYYQASAMNYYNRWFFTTSDGSATKSLENTLSEYDNLIAATDSGYLCVYQTYMEDIRPTIRCYQSNGAEAIIHAASDTASLYFTPLGNDRWLIQESAYVGWGEKDENDMYASYAAQSRYFLLDDTASITPLDTAGVMGTMFAEGDFPILDSSTARKPVTAALYNLFVGDYNYEGAEPLCSTTHLAWLGLADGLSDLAFLAAPTEEELAYLEDKGVDVEMKLYGGDGLVFIGNAANPVTDLTHEQILAIYRGEITNWSEVGGPDHPISVYYRDDQSGSQRLFENLVFKGLEVPDFANSGFMIMDDMSSIVDIILSDPYAIGYSIMTYLDDVYAEAALQVFSINGVVPSPETVADSSYAYHTKGYIVIRSDEPVDSPARRLYDWFGCPVSDELLQQCGVTPLSEE